MEMKAVFVARSLVSPAILISFLLAACGGGGVDAGSGSAGIPAASASLIALPETGQTTCADATGARQFRRR